MKIFLYPKQLTRNLIFKVNIFSKLIKKAQVFHLIFINYETLFQNHELIYYICIERNL